MREMLDSALKASPPELQGQLNYIIAQLGSTDDQWPGEFASDDEGMEEEENEVSSVIVYYIVFHDPFCIGGRDRVTGRRRG